MEDVHDKGVAELSAEPVELSGLFFVKRQDAQLRCIWDTRRANCHFEPPPLTHLASGEALADITVPAGRSLRFLSGRVDVCFYQYELPHHLRPYFTLPEVGRKFLRASFLRRLGIDSTGPPVSFQLSVIRMGWNWAVFLVQSAHLHMLNEVGAEHAWVCDKIPSPPLDQGKVPKVLYIDNVAARMLEAFDRRGVVAHRDSVVNDAVELLGFELMKDAASWRPTRKKFWRLAGSLEHLLTSRRCCTSREVEKLVGHLVAIFLLKREFLAILCSVYAFICTSYLRRQPLLGGAFAQSSRWCGTSCRR